MKSKIKKITSIIIVCVLMTIMVTACGNDMKKYSGVYVSPTMCTLVLSEDGNCTYTELDRTGTGNGE